MKSLKKNLQILYLCIYVICGQWMVFIISELLIADRVFFSELLNDVRGKSGQQISAKVLSNSLSVLEENGIVEREIVQEKPIRVQYSLTAKGAELEIIFGALKGWGIRWGGVKYKKCRSFTCVHDSVLALDIEKAKELLYSESSEAIQPM